MCSSSRVLACLFLVVLFFSDVSSFPSPGGRRQIGIHGRKQWKTSTNPGSSKIQRIQIESFERKYYNQTIDHFNYQPQSYDTFRQKFVVNFDYWGGAHSHSPIFVMLGDEAPMSDDACVGFLTDNAHRFRALLVSIEHRFYGESRPYGLTMKQVMNNESVRGYFNSAQALADYAEVILYLKEQLNATYSPVIVFGGSYGGMLAAWFRLKYPHIAMGALASSATIVNLDGIAPKDSYCSGVTKDFKETSQSCYETVKKSWDEIDRVASLPNGLSILTQKFNICKPLVDADELKNYLNDIYSNAAQYNYPELTSICEAIDAGDESTDILSRLYAAVVVNDGGSEACHHNVSAAKDPTRGRIKTGMGLADLHGSSTKMQCCSEVMIPDSCGTTPDSDMYESWSNEINETMLKEDCMAQYNVSPRPHWLTTNYGGHDMKLILKNFGSNIIFSNGLYDPYAGEGVLESLSDTLIAVKTEKGYYCQDIEPESPDDPSWLTDQRNEEIRILQDWIRSYHKDLRESGLLSVAATASSSSDLEPRRKLNLLSRLTTLMLMLYIWHWQLYMC